MESSRDGGSSVVQGKEQHSHLHRLVLQQQQQQQGFDNQPIQQRQQHFGQHGMMLQTRSFTHAAQTTSKEEVAAAATVGPAAYDPGEFDHALSLFLDGHDQASSSQAHHQEEKRECIGITNSACLETLNIFPSLPMHADVATTKCGGVTLASSSAASASRGTAVEEHAMMDFGNPRSVGPPAAALDHEVAAGKKPVAVKREGSAKKGAASTSSDQDGPRTPDAKTLRRLAQNREAARKSRLRKKAYVQSLESSRIRLVQLEQELHRTRSQGFLYGGGLEQGFVPSVAMGGITSEAAMFDMEYVRWLEDHQRLMSELRAGLQAAEERVASTGGAGTSSSSGVLPGAAAASSAEVELRVLVDGCVTHYAEMVALKSAAARSDAFHLLSGAWKSPAERCFMWIAGFRPSDLIKIIWNHIEPVTENQMLGLYNLQQSTQETEDALTQGLGDLHRSLSDTIAADDLSNPSNDMANYMSHMALAVSKLTTMEDFIRQADNLRQQTLQRLNQLLTTRQAARCFLAIFDYYHRLRALSSLWLNRPRVPDQ